MEVLMANGELFSPIASRFVRALALALLSGPSLGCWLVLGIEDVSGDGLTSTTGGGPCVASGATSCGEVAWGRLYGDADSQGGDDIAVDSAGNILVVGTYHGQINFGNQLQTSAGGKDIFVAKLNPEGEFVWSRSVGDAGNQFAAGVAVDSSDSVLVLGHFDGYADFGGGPVMSAGLHDIVVAKLTSEGNPTWTKGFGSPDEETSYAIDVDASDNIFITGFAASNIDFGGSSLMGSNGLVVAKLSPTGQHIYSDRFDTTAEAVIGGIAADASGSLVITGTFGGSLDFKESVEMTGIEDRDLFLAKLNPAGALVFSQAFGDDKHQLGRAVALDASGSIFIAADLFGSADVDDITLTSEGAEDVLLVKLDPNGDRLWGKRFGGMDGQKVTDITVDGSGNIVLIGTFRESVDFGGGLLKSAGSDDIFIAKLDSEGGHIWSRSFGDGAAQAAAAVAVDPSEYPIMTGEIFGSVELGAGPLESAGSNDVVVVKLSP
jgi:hypothetical protein